MLVPGSNPGRPTEGGTVSDTAIDLRSLTRFYGSRRGVEDLTLAIGRGEIFGFLGPNGAGKTTTIRLLLGLIRPTRGTAVVLGHDVATDSIGARWRIGFLSGEVALYPSMRVSEYLRFMGSFSSRYSLEQAIPYAERFDLDLGRRIGGLSKGNRQKVGLIAALQHKPDLLILDEPTTGLDPLLQQEMHAVLREERSRGATVFFSSHDLVEVQSLCDRVGMLRDGGLVQVLEVASLGTLRARRFLVTHRDGRVEERTVSGPLAPFLREVADAGATDLREHEVTLEESFLSLYDGAHR
ncbi:MAG TPA: ABC transporter ATP-binding protein [Candidatus Limnocylindria bacterium]|nr:ABC transporter ATP-binding protein [Candidatus Limnocylindria bacterium]